MNTDRHNKIIKFIWELMVRDGRKEYIIGRVKKEYCLDHETACEFFDIASKTCREFTADGIQGNVYEEQEAFDGNNAFSCEDTECWVSDMVRQEEEGILEKPWFWKSVLGVLTIFTLFVVFNTFAEIEKESGNKTSMDTEEYISDDTTTYNTVYNTSYQDSNASMNFTDYTPVRRVRLVSDINDTTGMANVIYLEVIPGNNYNNNFKSGNTNHFPNSGYNIPNIDDIIKMSVSQSLKRAEEFRRKTNWGKIKIPKIPPIRL